MKHNFVESKLRAIYRKKNLYLILGILTALFLFQIFLHLRYKQIPIDSEEILLNTSLDFHERDTFYFKNRRLKHIDLHHKIVFRSYYNQCKSCNDSILDVMAKIKESGVVKQLIFIGSGYNAYQTAVFMRVYQDLFSKIIIGPGVYSSFDLMNPPSPHLILVDTIGKSDFYFIEKINSTEIQILISALDQDTSIIDSKLYKVTNLSDFD